MLDAFFSRYIYVSLCTCFLLAICSFSVSAIAIIEEETWFCGDGVIDEGEECDDLLEPATCGDLWYGKGVVRCTWCVLDLSGCFEVEETICGDEILDDDEVCDNGESNGVICTAEYGLSCTYCAQNCNQEIVVRWSHCGDGYVDEWFESCDPWRIVSTKSEADMYVEVDEIRGCTDVAYGETCNFCVSTCEQEIVRWSFCGDGLVDAWFEICDDGNIANNDGCSSTCMIETVTKTWWGWGSTSSIPEIPTTIPILEKELETPTELLETWPEQEEKSVIHACEEAGYILGRYTKLINQDTITVYNIPYDMAPRLWSLLIEHIDMLVNQLTKLEGETRNDRIQHIVCKIEKLKESRGQRHAHIGYDHSVSVLDYLLQYIQDMIILQYVAE